MSASYPGSIKVFTTHQNLVESIDASHPNDIQAEVVAIENTLGLNPTLSTTNAPSGSYSNVANSYASVSARIANVEQGVMADTHSQYMKLAGGSTIVIGAAGTVGLSLQTAASQTADILSVLNSGAVKQTWLDSTNKLTIAGGLVVNSNGAVITGDLLLSGIVNAQKMSIVVPSAGAVGATIKLALTPTGDAFQIQSSTGTVIYRIGPTGVAPSQVSQAFFVGGAFGTGVRAARWIAPAPCVLTKGFARLDGGGSSPSVQWGLYVNGIQATTGGTGNLSASIALAAGVNTYTLTPSLTLNAGDSVQLYIGAVGGTPADFSVTLGGTWTAA